MLILISPAKKLDSHPDPWPEKFPATTQPQMLDASRELINQLQQLTPAEVGGLMKLSDKLATLNFERFQTWSEPFTHNNAQPALFAFQGDVYQGLDANQLSAEELQWAQQHLRILSGLYGVLRPLDLMQPYRLEMGTKFANHRGSNLYQFWGDAITAQLNQTCAETQHGVVVNLASNEYFSAVKPAQLDGELITPQFYDRKNGEYKIISFYAKRARGSMAAHIIKNRLTESQQLLDFDLDGYRYSDAMSKPGKPAFCRDPG
ncbi:peroxide stress protein YaaA [Porticoccaceae bacterium]|nr:peroxide stress protein YaaA [Porticoccaceae bacterium]